MYLRSAGRTFPPLHKEGGPPGSAPATHRSLSAPVGGSSVQLGSFRESPSQLPVQIRAPATPSPRSSSARAPSANGESYFLGFEISIPGNGWPAETMQNSVQLFDNSLVRDPRPRSYLAR